MEDGKVNVIDSAVSVEMGDTLSDLRHDFRGLVLTGNARAFCSGCDLDVIHGEDASARNQLVLDTWKLWLRLFTFPQPLVTAISGHALGMGAYLSLCGDYVFAASGAHKIGFSEVGLGIAMNSPPLLTPITRKLALQYQERAILHSELWTPEEAIAARMADATVAQEQLLAVSLEKARQLGEIPRQAFASTKDTLRCACAAEVQSAVDCWLKHGLPP